MPSIKRLGADEWREYRDLRLRALADAPDAFGSTLEAEQSRSDADWAARVAAATGSEWSLPLIAIEADELVGLVWARIDPAAPETANVYQMWVAPEARGVGIGGLLIDAVIAWARQARAGSIALYVTSGDTPARRLYERAGFEPVGELGPLRPGSTLFSQPMRLEL